MKTALKWAVYGVLGLVALVGFANADELSKALMVGIAAGYWGLHIIGKAIDDSRRDTVNRLERIYAKLDAVSQQQWRAENALDDVARDIAALKGEAGADPFESAGR